MQIITTPRQALDSLKKPGNQGPGENCGEIGKVYRPALFMKDAYSGKCTDSFEFYVLAGATQVINDPLVWNFINNGVPSTVNTGFSNRRGVFNNSESLTAKTGWIAPCVLTAMEIAIVDGQQFDGTIEMIRINPFGSDSSDFLDFTEAIRPKNEFAWLYKFEDMRTIVDPFTIISIVAGTYDVKISLRFSLFANSILMRKL